MHNSNYWNYFRTSQIQNQNAHLSNSTTQKSHMSCVQQCMIVCLFDFEFDMFEGNWRFSHFQTCFSSERVQTSIYCINQLMNLISFVFYFRFSFHVFNIFRPFCVYLFIYYLFMVWTWTMTINIIGQSSLI